MNIFLSIIAFILLMPTILFLCERSETLDAAFKRTNDKKFEKRSNRITGMLGVSVLVMISLALAIPQLIIPGSF